MGKIPSVPSFSVDAAACPSGLTAPNTVRSAQNVCRWHTAVSRDIGRLDGCILHSRGSANCALRYIFAGDRAILPTVKEKGV